MFTFRREELSNSMPVLTVEAPHLHAAMVSVYVRAGSRHETEENNGVSHFLEHIVFRGCDGFPSSRLLNAAVEVVGGSLNGLTTREHGCYYTLVHPNGLPRVLQVTGRMLSAPLLSELETEREVILEEILDEVDEEGRVIDIDTISKAIVYRDHPLGLPVAGRQETVRAITVEDLRRHHERYYDAGNLVLCVAGPVSHEHVVGLAQEAFGDIRRGEPSWVQAPPRFTAGPRFEHVRHRESQSDLRLTFPALHERHPDYPAQLLLTRILDDGLTSRLQQEIVEKRGLAYDVGANVDVFVDAALLEVEAASAHGKVPELIEALAATLSRLTREPPDDDEISRAKARQRYGMDFMQDSVGDLAEWFGIGELNHHPVSLEQRLAQVEAVSGEDVRLVASKLLSAERMLAVVVGLADEPACRKAVESIRLCAPFG